jgi:hypothetical protein
MNIAGASSCVRSIVGNHVAVKYKPSKPRVRRKRANSQREIKAMISVATVGFCATVEWLNLKSAVDGDSSGLRIESNGVNLSEERM